MRRLRASRFHLVFTAALVCLLSCAVAPPFNATAYQYAISLKVESLALMEKAADPYSGHEAEVKALNLELQKAYEFSKGRRKNEITTRQWEILLDPGRNLLGGFFSRWERESTLNPVFIAEAKELVSDAFDKISGLESERIKPGDVQ